MKLSQKVRNCLTLSLKSSQLCLISNERHVIVICNMLWVCQLLFCNDSCA